VPAGLRLGLLPLMLRDLGFRSTLRVISWLSAWSKHDSDDRHWHFGPIGVDPDVQGTGVGADQQQGKDPSSNTGQAVRFEDQPHSLNKIHRSGIHGIPHPSLDASLGRKLIRSVSIE
jgi:hypothetical protein